MFPILNSKPFWKGFSFLKKCVLVFYEKNLSGKDPKFLKFWLEIDSNSTQWDLLISTHWARISIHWDSWNIELESGSISFNCWIWRFVLFKLYMYRRNLRTHIWRILDGCVLYTNVGDLPRLYWRIYWRSISSLKIQWSKWSFYDPVTSALLERKSSTW